MVSGSDSPLSIEYTNPTTAESTDDGSNGKWVVLGLLVVLLLFFGALYLI